MFPCISRMSRSAQLTASASPRISSTRTGELDLRSCSLTSAPLFALSSSILAPCLPMILPASDSRTQYRLHLSPPLHVPTRWPRCSTSSRSSRSTSASAASASRSAPCAPFWKSAQSPTSASISATKSFRGAEPPPFVRKIHMVSTTRRRSAAPCSRRQRRSHWMPCPTRKAPACIASLIRLCSWLRGVISPASRLASRSACVNPVNCSL
mmetsp:Transcript_4159/g.13463  ORF Transcript_4159/g.13463 Transcript_4159/m.13463 type:complete len:210 (+) Transcript_4159:220-849(+)